MKIHETYIKRCIQIAKNGLPDAMPNPSVGALLTYNNTIIAEGFTSAYGGAHAEVNCIAFAKANLPQLLPESTLYVTLEPCSHYGKTPPCANLIIESGIKRVIIGTIDPHSKVAGNGIKLLLEAGIDVSVGMLEQECQEINKRFFTFHKSKRPYIILKWAASQDGFMAPLSRKAQKPVWITNDYSRQLVHKWRAEEQAILVGANTVIADNPSLTTRDWHGNSPVRVILDTRGTLSKKFAVFNDDAPTIILNTTDPKKICSSLYEAGIQSVIIEGGARTLRIFIEALLWDEARVFTGQTFLKEGIPAPTVGIQAIATQTLNIQEDRLTIFKNYRA